MVKGPAALLAAILATTIVVLPTAAPAQAVVTPPPIVEPTATVHGVVKDTTGAPIPGACIDVTTTFGPIYPLAYPLTTTCVGGDGAYSLRVPANNPRLRISARATGLNPVWWPDRADHNSGATSFAADEDRTADFVLGGAVGTLSGSVTRQAGDAERYPTIRLYPVGSTTPTALIIGKPDGTFSRTNIPVGQYQIKLAIHGYAEQWHPAKTSQADAATITITADQPASLTEQAIAVAVAPGPRPLANVSGVVKWGAIPIAGADVIAVNLLDGSKTQVKSDSTGKYRLDGLISGCNYSISATAAGRSAWALNNVVPNNPCIANSPIWDISIPDKAGTIKGVLRPYAGGVLPNNIFVALNNGGRGRAAVRLDGTYEFTNVPVGSYNIMFSTSRYQMFRNGAVSVADGQITEVTDTSFAPTYVEATVKAKDTGAPIGGACINTDFGAVSACANAEGVALIGPMWTRNPLNTLRVEGGIDYFDQNFPINMKVGEVSPVTVELSPAATVAFPVIKRDGTKITDQICVYAVQPKFTSSPEPAGCAVPNANGIVRVGPFAPGTARLLIVPSDANSGAQWLGPNGGTGRIEQAAPIDLRIGQTATAPKATLDPAGVLTANLVNVSGPQSGCLNIAGGRLHGCNSSEVNVFSLSGLGPYEWAISWRSYTLGYGRTTLLARPGRVNFPMVRKGKLTVRGTFYPSGSDLPNANAFDAYTGEFVAYAGLLGPDGVVFDGLGNGQVVIHFDTNVNGAPQSCWLKVDRKLFRFTQPYFSTTAGKNVTVDGVTCTQQEPLPLKVVEPSRSLPLTPATTKTATATTVRGKLRGHSN